MPVEIPQHWTGQLQIFDYVFGLEGARVWRTVVEQTGYEWFGNPNTSDGMSRHDRAVVYAVRVDLLEHCRLADLLRLLLNSEGRDTSVQPTAKTPTVKLMNEDQLDYVFVLNRHLTLMQQPWAETSELLGFSKGAADANFRSVLRATGRQRKNHTRAANPD